MRPATAHVLFLAYYFPPLESAGYSIRAVKFLKYLARDDLTFTVIAGDDRRPILTPVADSARFLLEEVPDTVRVIRVPAPLHAGAFTQPRRPARLARALIPPLADRWWMRRAASAARDAARARPVDVILATAPPFTIPVLAAQLKRRLGAPLVLDFRDDWLDTPIFDAKPPWQQAMHRRLERSAIGAADRVVTASEDSLLHFRRRYPEQAEKFAHLPNGWDHADMPEPLPAESRSPHFIIATAGGYQRADRSPEPLFRAVGQLAARRSDVRRQLRVQLVGSWLHRDFSAAELASLGVAEIVEEVAPLPKNELMRRLQQAELLLVIPTGYWTRSIPGKIYEYGALARAPLLLLDHVESAPARFVSAHGLGCVVARDDVAGIGRALERYFDAWAAGTPARIRPGALAAYSRKSLADQLSAVLFAARSW